eukprot:6197227-Pleurochrysis_carterae.AAC.1
MAVPRRRRRCCRSHRRGRRAAQTAPSCIASASPLRIGQAKRPQPQPRLFARHVSRHSSARWAYLLVARRTRARERGRPSQLWLRAAVMTMMTEDRTL